MAGKNIVLEPWDSIKLKKEDNSVSVKVWGREYEFEQSIFPSAIQTAGKDILAAPICLHAYFNGKEIEFTDTSILVLQEDKDKILLDVSQAADNIVCNGRVSVEYDGLVKISFSIIPFWGMAKIENNVPRLNKLYIDIPIKKDYASLYHFWPNDNSGGILPDPNIISSGKLPEGGMALPFKPCVWSGWEFGGIGVYAETDESIQVRDREKVIEFIENNDVVTMRIHLLDDIPVSWRNRVDQWRETLKPLEYTFGIQATPVKPMPQNISKEWRVYGNISTNSAKLLDERNAETGRTLMEELTANGVKWLILHETWSAIQNYGFAQDESDIKRIANECHKNGIKLMVYFGYEFSTLAPEWYEKADEYLLKTTSGEYAGGWQRKPHQRAFIACYHGGYAEKMRERIAYAMDEYGVDGIYTDGTYIPWECANETHGCGYRDKDGQLHTTYPVFAVREHVKKLYEIVHERNGVVDTHQSACCLAPALAFCDSYFDGENIQNALKQGIEFMSLDAFRAEYMGKNLGLPAHFLVQINTSDELKFAVKVLSITLLHDVQIRVSRVETLRYISKIWNAFDNFGKDEAYWYPYWECANPIKPVTNDTYCSVYEKGEEFLAVITVTDDNTASAELRTDWQIADAEDILNGEVVIVENSSIIVPVKAYNVCILKIRKV